MAGWRLTLMVEISSRAFAIFKCPQRVTAKQRTVFPYSSESAPAAQAQAWISSREASNLPLLSSTESL